MVLDTPPLVQDVVVYQSMEMVVVVVVEEHLFLVVLEIVLEILVVVTLGLIQQQGRVVEVEVPARLVETQQDQDLAVLLVVLVVLV